MFFSQFLQEQTTDDVTRSFVEYMLPSLMERYSSRSAKGGDHRKTTRISLETRAKWEEKPDQSMVSHQLNGIFPVMRLLNILEEEKLGRVPFTEVERKIYILSYLMHDVDKIADIQGVETRSREQIEQAKDLISSELRSCNAEAFFPEFAAYLEDIAYLVVNTQRVHGTQLNTYLWRFQLSEKRLLLLRELCTFSDTIAYFITAPADIVTSDQGKKLSDILGLLSDNQLVFTFHQLREVRGLLTNVINNGLVSLFIENRASIWPYLFFSNGVVYMKRKALQFTLESEQIVTAVQESVRNICAETVKNTAPGFKFSIQGIAKHPGYYFEFLSLEEYTELLVRFTINRTVNDITVIPMTKLRQMQAAGDISADIALDLYSGKHSGMVARFLSVVFSSLLSLLDKKQEALRNLVTEKVIEHLELKPYWAQAQTIPNKGGVEYRWFWLGACYLNDHKGLEADDLREVFNSTMQLILDLAGDELRQQMPRRYLTHLTRYLDSVVELPASVRPGGMLPDFQGELDRYMGAKSKGRKLICTLCNSAYPTEEQADNSVLFQPWVYKNKLSLYAGKNAGGVCAICSLELMLRQILQKGNLRLTGSKFEAMKTKFVSVYPNFFFTAETGAIVEGILDQLQSINFFTIRHELDGQDITVRTLLNLEAFAAPIPVRKFGQTLSDDELLDEDEDEGDEEAVSATANRGYIKFQNAHYPGMSFFGMPAGKDDNDTASWAMPAFLALALPLVCSIKLVISEMSLPLFSSGHDFRETVVFDAPHPYLDYILKEKRVRVNQLLERLQLLSSIYRVNLDTYAKQGKPEWKHLSDIARDLATDPLYLFHYLKKQQRGDSLYASDVEEYLHIYKDILEADVSKIQRCVELYTKFYRGGYKSHSILKPVDIVAKAIINSPLNIEEDDLLWQIQGEIKNWLDRVRGGNASGWAVIPVKDTDSRQAPAIREFVEYFYKVVFQDYCEGERGLLRSRINRFKDGCEACYVHMRNQQRIQEQPEEPVVEPVS